jgi:hypothetical protein
MTDALSPIRYACDPRDGLQAVLRTQPELREHLPLLEQITALEEEARAAEAAASEIRQRIEETTTQLHQAMEDQL